MLALNETLQGRYRVTGQLGQGGMGAVYEAEDNKRFNKLVALKEILIDLSKISTPHQQEILKRAFEREAKLLTRLDHEAFPQVVDYFVETDRQYLVMELIKGDDLDKQLKIREKAFSLEEVLKFAAQLLDALDYLHTLNPPVVHRDIKPQNLKLSSRGRIKLLDFGIAKGSEAQLNTTLTDQTFIAATLNYSPFEQIFRVLDENYREFIIEKYSEKAKLFLPFTVDAKSDIYSLGATFYHLLTGCLPVDSLKRSLEIWAGKDDPLAHPNKINLQIPAGISDWLMKAMQIERGNRYESAIEMQEALNEFVRNEKLRTEEAKRQQWSREQELLREQERFREQEKLKKEQELIVEEQNNIERTRLIHQEQFEAARRQIDVENQRLQLAKQQVIDDRKRFREDSPQTYTYTEASKDETKKKQPSSKGIVNKEDSETSSTLFDSLNATLPNTVIDGALLKDSIFEFEKNKVPSVDTEKRILLPFKQKKLSVGMIMLIIILLSTIGLSALLLPNYSNKRNSDSSTSNILTPTIKIENTTNTGSVADSSTKQNINTATDSKVKPITGLNSDSISAKVIENKKNNQRSLPQTTPMVKTRENSLPKKVIVKPSTSPKKSNPDCIFTDDCK